MSFLAQIIKAEWFILALAPSALVVVISIAWMLRPRGFLYFDELREDEQDNYLALVNNIDTKLLDKFLSSLPLKLGFMLLTGGTSLWFSGLRWMYLLGKKSNAISAVKLYVEGRRKRYRRKFVDWDSFPGVHIVMGGKRRVSNKPSIQCPVCRQETLQQFLINSEREILSCSNCSKNVVIKRSESTRRAEMILIPGFYALSIPFTSGIGPVLDGVADADGVLEALGSLLDYIM